VTTPDTPVADVMTTVVFSARPQTLVSELRPAMLEQGLHFVPVLEDGVAVGVVSLWDLLIEASAVRMVSEIMTTPPITVPPVSSIREVASRMRFAAVHHLLVVEDGRMAGSVSALDLLQALEV
jgi:CBS domain-containing protein